jgi:hypothetical protein
LPAWQVICGGTIYVSIAPDCSVRLPGLGNTLKRRTILSVTDATPKKGAPLTIAGHLYKPASGGPLGRNEPVKDKPYA